MTDIEPSSPPADALAPLVADWTRIMQAPAMLTDEPVDPELAILQLMALEELKKRFVAVAKLIEEKLQEFGLEQVRQHGKALFPYYAGTEKTEKCRDVRKLLEHLLAATDMDTLASLLSSSAWKPGACKPVLGDEWHEHFEVTTGEKLKESEGEKAKQVKLLKMSEFALGR